MGWGMTPGERINKRSSEEKERERVELRTDRESENVRERLSE
jgi:hypothetical protein